MNIESGVASESPLKLVLSKLPDAKRSGKLWKACCPAHDDHSFSLTVGESEHGEVLLECQAGCEKSTVLAAMNLALSSLAAGTQSPGASRAYRWKRARMTGARTASFETAAANTAGSLDEGDEEALEKGDDPGESSEETLSCLEVAPISPETEEQGAFRSSPSGVWYIPPPGKDEPDYWVCAELRIRASTRNGNSEDWGRLLEWKDPDGRLHRWVMAVEHLQGDGNEVRRELASGGLAMATGKKARDLLTCYLQAWHVRDRVRCVTQLGWHGNVYVTPTETIGPTEEPFIFSNPHSMSPRWSTSGTLEDWQRLVAAPASGNTRLVFTICTAFAGPLLNLANMDSGGVHIRGSSSSGKSTALRLAASVWGKPKDYCDLWHSTNNALEGKAALHNDGLLILDELAQMRSEDVGDAAYLLANGQGKSRASRTAMARKAISWRLLFLSAGEISLAAHIESGGRRANAGQELRLAEVEVDAGRGMGILENLHAYDEAIVLIDALNKASEQHYGVAGLEFLRQLTAHLPSLLERIQRRIKEFSEKHVPRAATSQAQRVASRFAIIAVAGELATSMGLTGWDAGEAENAAAVCFGSWLNNFGSGQMREITHMLQRIRHLLQVDANRFERVWDGSEVGVHNRAGYFRETRAEGKQYLVFPEVFRKEICDTLDKRQAIAHLKERGWLVPDTDGRSTQKPRIFGLTRRLYVFSAKALEDEI